MPVAGFCVIVGCKLIQSESNIAPVRHGEEAVEVACRDRSSDRKAVVAGWDRHPHPVEEHTGVEFVDRSILDGVIERQRI